MAHIMTKSGSEDNVLTYEFMCDTAADMTDIDPHYITLGSTCIVLQGESEGLEIYIANTNKEWEIVSTINNGGAALTVIAQEYDSTDTYAIGDYCIYNDTLYKCSTAINIAEEWDENHWTATSVMAEVSNYSANIESAVAGWLTTHPEATTTVRDGSLTESKFSSALILKTIKDYVTPEMYGAAGDGTTDDTAAFNSALATGKPVLLDVKTYRLASAIDNPTNLILIGSGRSENGTVVNCESSFLQNAIASSLIKDIRIMAPFSSSLVAFPSNVTGSIVQGCFFQYWNTIFNSIKTCSVIENNRFVYIKEYFCKGLVDSFVRNNYINAPKISNPQTICFTATIAHSIISNNFIDYMYKVFSGTSIDGLTVTGNQFDVCYCIFYNGVSKTTFTGNTITNARKRSTWDVSGNEEMNTTQWCVIKRIGTSGGTYSVLADSYFGGNTFDNMSAEGLETYLVSNEYAYPTRNIIIDESLPSTYFDFKARASNYTSDLENIQIRPMLKRTVEALPSNPNTNNKTVFEFDEVIYNGELYIYINGTWKQLTNAT